jgi:UDP-N-acetylglucosamine:LPS N-acetylglucosamine transferase
MKGLKEKGYDVRCVVNGWNDGDFKNRLSKINVTCYEVKLGWLYLTKPMWTFDTLRNYPQAYRKCKKIIQDFNPDIFHFTSYPVAIMLYPLIGRNAIYTLHDTQLPTFKHLLIYKWLNKKIHTFVGVSNLISSTLENLKVTRRKNSRNL